MCQRYAGPTRTASFNRNRRTRQAPIQPTHGRLWRAGASFSIAAMAYALEPGICAASLDREAAIDRALGHAHTEKALDGRAHVRDAHGLGGGGEDIVDRLLHGAAAWPQPLALARRLSRLAEKPPTQSVQAFEPLAIGAVGKCSG